MLKNLNTFTGHFEGMVDIPFVAVTSLMGSCFQQRRICSCDTRLAQVQKRKLFCEMYSAHREHCLRWFDSTANCQVSVLVLVLTTLLQYGFVPHPICIS